MALSISLLTIVAAFSFVNVKQVDSAASSNELKELFTKLWQMDRAEMQPITGNSRLNRQGRVGYTVGIPRDVATGPLFAGVNAARLQGKPTIKAFRKLMDNYIQNVGARENEDRNEQMEITEFLNAVLRTPVMKKAHQFLAGKNLSPRNTRDFWQQLYDIWFRFYRRNGPDDSSAFEHVFVGEIRNTDVLGLHNWIRFYEQEKANIINYYGYKKVCGAPPSMISVTFRIGSNAYKLVGGMFVGTSPEFELAVYTVAYLTGFTNTEVMFGTCPATIVCHRLGRERLGSCFPKF